MYRIMLVEDDRELGETIKSLLTLKGYDVTLIGSVKEYNKHTEVYDMYLLDVKLPDGDVYKNGELAIYFDKYKLYRAGNELKLSNNEWDMLKILVENKGRVVRRDVFFDRLWDIHGNYVEYNTLTVNMSRLKAKLGTFGDERVPYIETIRNVGYRWIA